MARWRAVVFDLDDTLYPERDFVRGGFEAAAGWAAQALGADRARTADELWADFEAGARGDLFDRWLARRGFAVEANRSAMIDAYRNHRPRLAPYPDVGPTLSGLRGRRRLGLITEGVRAVQEAKLQALALAPSFDKIVILGEEEHAEWKPSPQPFARWLEGTGIAPGEALYVGDNPAKDFLGARRAGWASVRLRRTGGLHEHEEAAPEAAPDHEMQGLQPLIALLEASG